MRKNCEREKVMVAMSGGLDSSVAAALLKKRGYDVVGIFLRLWESEAYFEAEKNAKKVAKILGVPLHIIDAKKEFKKEIVDYFLRGCEKGYMFNPCVKCNPEIKFKFLLEKMKELKYDWVATGHYARRRREIQNSPPEADQPLAEKLQISNKLQVTSYKLQATYKLFQAEDKNKDQSYFLYGLKRKQLAKIIFPLGDYKKTEVLKMAKKFKLPEFRKEDDSQGACFIAEKYPDKFLKRNLKMRKGEIADQQGNILGEHQGLPLYIIGQRRMINIGGTGPYYVIKRDFKNNLLVVTRNVKDPKLYGKSVKLKKVNWIIRKPKFPFKAKVKIRYQHPAISATIVHSSQFTVCGFYEVVFNKPQRAAAIGQSAVFYSDKGELLGGGIMKEAQK